MMFELSNGEAESVLEQRMLGAGYDGFDQMMASVRRRQYKKRRLQSALFSLTTDPATGSVSLKSNTLFHCIIHLVCVLD